MEAELTGNAPMTCQPTKAAWWSVRGMLAQECTSRRSSAPALACIPITPRSSRANTSGSGYCEKSKSATAAPVIESVTRHTPHTQIFKPLSGKVYNQTPDLH